METSTARKHRPRSQPTPIGRQTLITDNDIFGIFEPLSRHAQLTTKQIVAFDPRYASTVRNRLTDLYHAEGEWLVRLSETLKLANYPHHRRDVSARRLRRRLAQSARDHPF
jgi:hypothetical protein